MNYNKSRIQVIGSYLEQVTKVLDSMGVFTENTINNCSPLAMTGTFDKAYQKYSDMTELKPHELLSIRKNLDKVLSHDPKNFTDNYNIQPPGKEVRSQNTSEYLVFMNSSMELTVLEKADMVYSEYTTVEIVNTIKNSEGGCTRRTFPFSGSFNWKYYYDRFIDVVLNEYNPDHIIFIRSNCSRFYMNECDIKTDTVLSERFIGMLEKMDNYFIEKTHCLVVDEHYNNIPPRYVNCLFPYIQMSVKSSSAIAEAIYDIIANKNIDSYKPQICGYTGAFTKVLFSRLSKDIIEQNMEQLKYIDDNMLNIDKLSKIQSGTCEFFYNVIKLKQFLDIENKYRLAEYAVDVQNKKNAANIELIELYTRYFKLDLNDIISVYLLCNDCEDVAEYKKIVSNILSNSDCIPVNSARKFKEKNIVFLKEYAYISIKEFTEDKGDVYVPLENNCWLVLNPNSETPIKKFEFNECKEFDYNKVISDGYICSIENADALTYSYDYYVEKARNGDGAKPTFLEFDTVEEFVDSLSYINYAELLENERFVLNIEGAAPSCEGYAPIADFTDFMDPNTVIVPISDGLGDQISYYIMGQLIKEQTGRNVLYYDHCRVFNGLEVTKLALKEMNFANDRLSQRLNYNCDFFKDVCMRISKDYFYFTNMIRRDPQCSTVLLVRNIKQLLTVNLPYTFMNAIVHAENWRAALDYDIHKYIGFPPLTVKENIDIQNEMLACDAVVIHVRRGDYVQYFINRGKCFNYGWYIEAMQKLLAIPDYPNKKYFVFSDDIQWCKDNISSLGLDLIGNSEIRFVNSNKFDESFRDMQLMSYGKIMIGGNSGFFNFASLYSDRCEVYIGAKDFMRSFMGNKYDIGSFKEELVIDINEKKVTVDASPRPIEQIKDNNAPQKNASQRPKVISPTPQTALDINLLRQINRVESIGGSVFDYFIDKGIDKINLYGNDDLIAFLYEHANLKGLQINKCFSDKEHSYNVNLLDKHLKIGEKDVIAPTQIKTECTNINDNNFPTVILSKTDKPFSSMYTVESLLNYSSLMQCLFRTVFEYKQQHAPKLKIIVVRFPFLSRVQNKNEYEIAVLNKTNKISPLKKLGYDDEFIKDVNWLFPEYYNGETPMLVDHQSKYVNIINGHRVTVGLPENASHTMFVFGPSVVFGYLTDDEHTIASCIQRELNRNNVDPVYQVLNCSFAGGENYIAMRRSFLANKPQNGDIAVFFHWPDISLLEDVHKDEFYYFNPQKEQHIFDRPHDRGEYLFYDNVHLLPAGYDWLGEVVVQKLIETGLLKDDDNTEAEDIDINVPVAVQSSEELPASLSSYLNDIGKQKPLAGAIVMNCNPFTLGHRYLVEYAASKCDRLYIFAVEEDLSFFPFADRIELIKQGVSDLKNVTVLPSGNFIISRTTFPAYFEKEASTDDTVIDASSDIEIFAKHIAPQLNITVRFAGEEPLDNVTRQYNSQMRRILPQYGIKFDVIPRKEINGQVVSASRVRKLLKEKDFEGIKSLVPPTTYEYLKINFDK